MDLLATGNTVKPGLPARNGDAASDGEKSDESATFEVFLDLALTFPSPDAVIVPGPEGKPAPGDGLDALLDITGNPALQGGNLLPVDLPVSLGAIVGASSPTGRSDKAVATAPLNIPAIAQPIGDSRGEAPVADRRGLPTPSPAGPIDADLVASEPAITKALDLLPRAAVASQPAPATQLASPQATSPQSVVAQVITIAHTGTPVVSVLAGRQSRVAETPRTTPAPDVLGEAAPLADEPLPALQPTAPAIAARSDSEKLPSSPQGLAPDARGAADAADTKAKRSLPDPAALSQPATPLNLAEPIMSVSDARTGVTAQPSGTATATAAPSQSTAREFGQIVDRLARAREAEQPDFVQSTLTTRDFGTVSMQLRPLEGRLHVAMTSADPGFAPAVQASSAMSGTGQQALSENANQSQSQQQQPPQQSGQGQSAPDSQARRQQWERATQGQSPQAPASSSGDHNAKRGSGPRGAASDSIYA